MANHWQKQKEKNRLSRTKGPRRHKSYPRATRPTSHRDGSWIPSGSSSAFRTFVECSHYMGPHIIRAAPFRGHCFRRTTSLASRSEEFARGAEAARGGTDNKR